MSGIDFREIEVAINDVVDKPEAIKVDPAKIPADHSATEHAAHLQLHGQETLEVSKQSASIPAEPVKAASHEQILSQVKDKLAASEIGRDGGQIVLRLHPDDLGELKIDVRMDNQKLRIDITTESQTVKEALLTNVNSLKEVLSKQNISMERFDVSTGGNPFQQNFRDGGSWRQNGQNPQQSARWGGGRAEEGQGAVPGYGQKREYAMLDVRF
jgi:flagellar hook-length control protein FliK